jgi:DNA-binding YbaB/EbfC family protein
MKNRGMPLLPIPFGTKAKVCKLSNLSVTDKDGCNLVKLNRSLAGMFKNLNKFKKMNSHLGLNPYFCTLNFKKKTMFGDMMNLMGKLKETQQKVEATKKRLDTVLMDEKSNDGLLEITITANRVIKKIHISEALFEDKEQLEDYLILTLNKAIEKASKVNEAELAAVAKEGMPNIPGMDLFK